jgi:hypothetical protein
MTIVCLWGNSTDLSLLIDVRGLPLYTRAGVLRGFADAVPLLSASPR